MPPCRSSRPAPPSSLLPTPRAASPPHPHSSLSHVSPVRVACRCCLRRCRFGLRRFLHSSCSRQTQRGAQHLHPVSNRDALNIRHRSLRFQPVHFVRQCCLNVRWPSFLPPASCRLPPASLCILAPLRQGGRERINITGRDGEREQLMQWMICTVLASRRSVLTFLVRKGSAHRVRESARAWHENCLVG